LEPAREVSTIRRAMAAYQRDLVDCLGAMGARQVCR
jgi:hypothetical protein